jgi:hypothetical protein
LARVVAWVPNRSSAAVMGMTSELAAERIGHLPQPCPFRVLRALAGAAPRALGHNTKWPVWYAFNENRPSQERAHE